MSESSQARRPPRSILLATDLSARGDRALERAVSLAKHWKAHLTILHVLEEEMPSLDPDLLPSWKRSAEPVDKVRDHILADLGELAEAATILVERGATIDTIMRVAAISSSELIVIGVARNELLGQLMLGRTVDGLLRHSGVPVLVVKERVRHPYRRIVVATDFSESSRHALVTAMHFFADEAFDILHAYDAPMSGLVGDPATYRLQYRKLAELDCEAFLRDTAELASRRERPNVLLEYGAPGHLLREYAVDHSADLVVVGTHGRSAIFDVLLGSVAKQILEGVPCDTLVVREPRAKPQT
ncbi:MAG TPA: universal stress protein [Povalibacter sp.]|nr:universal stress protein [Povalibacter sp.]